MKCSRCGKPVAEHNPECPSCRISDQSPRSANTNVSGSSGRVLRDERSKSKPTPTSMSDPGADEGSDKRMWDAIYADAIAGRLDPLPDVETRVLPKSVSHIMCGTYADYAWVCRVRHAVGEDRDVIYPCREPAKRLGVSHETTNVAIRWFVKHGYFELGDDTDVYARKGQRKPWVLKPFPVALERREQPATHPVHESPVPAAQVGLVGGAVADGIAAPGDAANGGENASIHAANHTVPSGGHALVPDALVWEFAGFDNPGFPRLEDAVLAGVVA